MKRNKIHNLLATAMLMILSCVQAVATPITRQQALDKARSFLSSGGSSRRGMPRSATSLKLAAIRHYKATERLMAPCIYVFNVGIDGGFVVVSGDDRLPPVLGYADSGTYDEDTMPENMRKWLESYALQMEWLSSHPEAAARRNVVKGGTIAPLIKSKWGQGSPYNDLCPTYEEGHYVTGCVATAMAQVMYYHQWPKHTTAEIAAYTSNTQKISMPAIAAGTTIDWANILPHYDASASSTQRAAVAQLMLICGTAVKMDYAADGSGTYTDLAADALRNYFDYDASTDIKSRRSYTHTQWNQLIYDELSAGRPVMYDGSSDYGGISAGHAFVVDGYGGDDFFHVNWGWGGYKDSYFLLSVLDDNAAIGEGAASSIDGYSWGQHAIIGIQPNTGRPRVAEIKMSTTTMSLPDGSSDTYTRSSANEDFTFTVTGDIWNYTDGTNTFDCGAYGIFDMDDHLIAVGCDYYTRTYEVTYGARNMQREVNFGVGISSGHYKVKAISRQAGTSTWLDNSYSPDCYIEAIINGNTLKLIAPSVSLNGSLRVTGKTERMSRLSLEATIVNNGSFVCREFYLLAGGVSVGGRMVEIEAGTTVTLPLSFTPTSSGTKELLLCYYSNGYIPVASCTVTITDPPYASLSITESTANATNGIVKENMIVVNASVKNNGSQTYDNAIIGELYKLRDDGSGYGDKVVEGRKDILVLPGKSTSVELTFDNLENGSYFYDLYYFSEGKQKWGAESDIVTVQAEQNQSVKGDVNGDGEVNVTDLVPLVNMILGMTQSTTAGDVNGDGEVNVTDLVPLVNLILKY